MKGLFHTPKPYKYRIEPRFWDPEREKREKRDRRISAEMGIENKDGEYRPNIGKGDFKQRLSNSPWSAVRQRRKSNTRLVVLIIIMLASLYFLM